jgi:hemerythrin
MRPRAWDEAIATGIPSLDQEHQLQVGLLNALEQVLRQGTDRALAEKTLQQLVDFTSVHFHSEELMMRLYSYPQHDAHALEHARLMEQVAKIREGLPGDVARALEMVARLRTWLTSHIRSMDQGFALWCSRSGIRTDAPPG